jgi:hypothetical protein
MEIALPVLALGGLYIISNNKSNTNNEQFTNMGKNNNTLPNTNIPPNNYPTNINESTPIDDLRVYSSNKDATNTYINQSHYQNEELKGTNVGNNIQQIYSLSGDYINKGDFKHNNMVPFTGPKVRGQTYGMDRNESVLDNMVGNGSQSIKKIDQAPLFKPEENIQYANGTPNHSDFYQSRVNPSMSSNGVKPFESINVAPGLNQGYGTDGNGGFNSGLSQRSLYMPKTVDDLRTANNPKMEYDLIGHEGPSYSHIQNAGKIGEMEKNRPDTFYMNTQDRWLTTTGQEKGETLRPIIKNKETNRNVGEINYAGPAGSTEEKKANYIPSVYEPTRKNEYNSPDVMCSNAVGKGSYNDNNFKSHTNYVTNRSANTQDTRFGNGISSAIGAVLAPIMDILKPNKKAEYTENLRIYGNMDGGHVKPYQNNNTVVPTTVKETTIYKPTSYINNQSAGTGAYVNTKHEIGINQRDTTNYRSNGYVNGSNNLGGMLYDSAYNTTPYEEKEKTLNTHHNQGGTQIFNQQMNNFNINKLESDVSNSRQYGNPIMPNNIPTSSLIGKSEKMPQEYKSVNCERINPEILSSFKKNPYTHSVTNAFN